MNWTCSSVQFISDENSDVKVGSACMTYTTHISLVQTAALIDVCMSARAQTVLRVNSLRLQLNLVVLHSHETAMPLAELDASR